MCGDGRFVLFSLRYRHQGVGKGGGPSPEEGAEGS